MDPTRMDLTRRMGMLLGKQIHVRMPKQSVKGRLVEADDVSFTLVQDDLPSRPLVFAIWNVCMVQTIPG